MASAWDWWQRALEDPKAIGGETLQITTEPQQGFYRARFKHGPWEPVAIWWDTDQWKALRNDRPVEADDVWTYCCRQPVSHEAYENAVATGRWDDADATVEKAMIGPGHNVGKIDDFELLSSEIDSAEQGFENYRGISDDEQAGRAQSLRARLNELAGQADKLREAAKRPHLEAGKEVDAKWMPLVKSAKAIADAIKREIEAFQTHKLREQRRLEEERRREEEAARAKSGEDAAPPPPPPPPAPIATPTVKGAYGRAATVKAELVVTGITDQDALYQFMRNEPDLKACLLKLAQSFVKAGTTPPGVKVEEQARVS